MLASIALFNKAETTAIQSQTFVNCRQAGDASGYSSNRKAPQW